MRKLLLLLLAAASVTAAGAAAKQASTATAATQTVTITAKGYSPTAVSIFVGDTVSFANKDTVAHTVQYKATAGLHCPAALQFTVAAGQSASCTFTNAGKFTFSDAAHKGKAFRETVTVATSATAGGLTVNPGLVVYGHKSNIAGTLASQLTGQSVQIQATECGTTTSKLAGTVTTTTGGKFTFAASPLKQTAYSAKVKNSSSPSATVKVAPFLQLTKLARHRFTVRVSAAESFAGKLATFQRYRRTTKRWVKVKRVLLKSDTSGVAPTVISSAKFRSRIKARQRVRVTLGSKQVGLCYAPGHSRTIRS
jgi:plastocyanin